jgi:hypothetical protein
MHHIVSSRAPHVLSRFLHSQYASSGRRPSFLRRANIIASAHLSVSDKSFAGHTKSFSSGQMMGSVAESKQSRQPSLFRITPIALT